MRRSGDPHGRYADMFSEFFKNSRMSSTYKPVFLAALVDVVSRRRGGPLDAARWISVKDGQICVDLGLVAVPFAKHYWDMAAAFDPRHTPPRMADPGNPGRDISIVGLIRDEMRRMKEEEACGERAGAGAGREARGRKRGAVHSPAGGVPPTLAELASDKMAGFRRRVVAKSIKPNILAYPHKDMLGLYEIERGGNRIVLDAAAMDYMKRDAAALRAALGELVARHLEAINPRRGARRPW